MEKKKNRKELSDLDALWGCTMLIAIGLFVTFVVSVVALIKVW